jgi:hypothetical protein
LVVEAMLFRVCVLYSIGNLLVLASIE